MHTDPQGMRSKAALVSGDVRPWHVIFLFLVIWSVSLVASYELTTRVAPSVRMEFRQIAMSTIFAALCLVFTITVPEFRRSLSLLFAIPIRKVDIPDMAWTFAAMLCWGYGIYRVAICLPIAYLDLSLRDKFIMQALAPFEWKFLVFLAGAVIVAPIGEELFFRGYLLNLWIARWGTVGAVLASSIVFGLFHDYATLYAAPLGIILALVYLRYDSLWPGIALHALYNLFAFPWILGGLFYVRPRDATYQLATWAPEIVVSLLAVPVFAVFLRRFRVRNSN